MLTYSDLDNFNDDQDSKILYTGLLTGKKSQKFRLRMWVADTYGLIADTRMFSTKISVRVK